MLLYYITDRRQLGDRESERRVALIEKIRQAMESGVDYVQLREKDLSPRELESLATKVVRLRSEIPGCVTSLLVNSRTDVALAAGADGVHLRSSDVSPDQVRMLWSRAGAGRPVISVSCHTVEEVQTVQSEADFVVCGPVFEKSGSEVAGLETLWQVARVGVPVLALGGVTPRNARQCLDAGAAGVAGIRLFQSHFLPETIKSLRSLDA